jgi:hypothetical protein
MYGSHEKSWLRVSMPCRAPKKVSAEMTTEMRCPRCDDLEGPPDPLDEEEMLSE